jgi:hypothetical protein
MGPCGHKPRHAPAPAMYSPFCPASLVASDMSSPVCVDLKDSGRPKIADNTFIRELKQQRDAHRASPVGLRGSAGAQPESPASQGSLRGHRWGSNWVNPSDMVRYHAHVHLQRRVRAACTPHARPRFSPTGYRGWRFAGTQASWCAGGTTEALNPDQ